MWMNKFAEDLVFEEASGCDFRHSGHICQRCLADGDGELGCHRTGDLLSIKLRVEEDLDASKSRVVRSLFDLTNGQRVFCRLNAVESHLS
jgi:hypothetical protein